MEFSDIADKAKSNPYILWGGLGLVAVVGYMALRNGGGNSPSGSPQFGGGLSFGGETAQGGGTSGSGGSDPVAQLQAALDAQYNNAKRMLGLQNEQSDYELALAEKAGKSQLWFNQASALFGLETAQKSGEIQNNLQLQAGRNQIALAGESAAQSIKNAGETFAYQFQKVLPGSEYGATYTRQDAEAYVRQTQPLLFTNSWFKSLADKAIDALVGKPMGGTNISRQDVAAQYQQKNLNATVAAQKELISAAQPKQTSQCKPILGFGCGSQGFISTWGGAIENAITGGISSIIKGTSVPSQTVSNNSVLQGIGNPATNNTNPTNFPFNIGTDVYTV